MTLNPALDLSGQVEHLVANEKNYVHDEKRDPGGNGINASRIIHRLGASTLALGFLGGPVGREVEGLLDHEGVPHRFTKIRGHTRINVTVNNHEDHRQTRLTFPGPRVDASERSKISAEIAKLRGPGIFVVGGSTPPGCPKDFHLKLALVARRAGLEVAVDVPAKFIRELTEEGRIRALLLKPNQAELEEWWGEKLNSEK